MQIFHLQSKQMNDTSFPSSKTISCPNNKVNYPLPTQSHPSFNKTNQSGYSFVGVSAADESENYGKVKEKNSLSIGCENVTVAISIILAYFNLFFLSKHSSKVVSAGFGTLNKDCETESVVTSGSNQSKNIDVALPTSKYNRRPKIISSNGIGFVFVVVVLFCLTTSAEGVACTQTDGTVINDATCTCGTVDCTVSTGLICYATVGGGSCRKTALGNYGYPQPKVERCSTYSGRKVIGDAASCEAAGRSIGMIQTVALVNAPHYSPGCLVQNGVLRFNINMASTYKCSEKHCSGRGICMAAPVCTITNGAASNDAPCLCGSVGCTVSSGLYCDASTSTCGRGDACIHSNGLISNTVACACGPIRTRIAGGNPGVLTSACSTLSGTYCYAEASQCSPTAFTTLCPIRDGSGVNSDECQCGTKTW